MFFQYHTPEAFLHVAYCGRSGALCWKLSVIAPKTWKLQSHKTQQNFVRSVSISNISNTLGTVINWFIFYWLPKLFAHFVNRCQWGRSSREFCGEIKRVISSLSLHALVLFLSICITCSCIISCCFAWWCLIPYINSLESDCHQLPKWGRLKEHVLPPCLVLVIDDNLYGLMVSLIYILKK